MVTGKQRVRILDHHARYSRIANLEEITPLSNIKQFIIAKKETIVNSNLLVVEVFKCYFCKFLNSLWTKVTKILPILCMYKKL